MEPDTTPLNAVCFSPSNMVVKCEADFGMKHMAVTGKRFTRPGLAESGQDVDIALDSAAFHQFLSEALDDFDSDSATSLRVYDEPYNEIMSMASLRELPENVILPSSGDAVSAHTKEDTPMHDSSTYDFCSAANIVTLPSSDIAIESRPHLDTYRLTLVHSSAIAENDSWSGTQLPIKDSWSSTQTYDFCNAANIVILPSSGNAPIESRPKDAHRAAHVHGSAIVIAEKDSWSGTQLPQMDLWLNSKLPTKSVTINPPGISNVLVHPIADATLIGSNELRSKTAVCMINSNDIGRGLSDRDLTRRQQVTYPTWRRRYVVSA